MISRLIPLSNKKVCIYTRVSSNEQVRTGFGLQYQLQECRAKCRAKGFQIVKEYVEEAISGASEVNKRPRFKKLLEDAKNGLFDVICIWKFDRLARNTRIMQNIYYDLKTEYKIELLSCMEDIDTNTANGKFLLDVMGSVSELELRTMKARMNAGREMKRKQVGYTGGPLPYGYSLLDKQIVINEKTSKIVKWIFQMKDVGINNNKISVTLNENGVLSPRGKKWSSNGVNTVIKNRETYKGGLIYGNDNNIRWPKII